MTLRERIFQHFQHPRVRLIPYILVLSLLVTTIHLGNTTAVPPLEGWGATSVHVISTNSTNPSYYHTTATDSKGNVYVAWTDSTAFASSGTDADIVLRIFNATTETWSTIQVISTQSSSSSISPNLALDHQNNIHVVWREGSDIVYKMYNTTTTTWSAQQVVSIGSSQTSYNPIVIVDSSFNVHVLWTEYTTSTEFSLLYNMYNATTTSWGSTIKISTESGSSSTARYPDAAIDSHDNIHVVWKDNTDYSSSGTDYDIFYKMYNATAAIWTTTQVVSTQSTGTSDHPQVATDSQDTVHVIWQDPTNYTNSGIDYDIFYKMYNATSATWSTTQVVTTLSSVNSMNPSMALDSHDNIHLTWEEQTTPIVIFHKMYNQTQSIWELPNQVSTKNTQDNVMPNIVIGNHDNIHITWESAANYDNSGMDSDIVYREYVNLAYLPVTTTETSTQQNTVTQTDTTTQTNTQVNTVTQSTTEHQTDITTVISTVSGTSNQNSTTNSSPWFILPTLMAILSLGYVFQKRRNETNNI